MPAGQVIGRISVRVLPDTSDFKEEAKKQLRRIEQQLTVTINTKIDTTGARRGVLEAVRDINRDNKVDSRKIRFYTKIATDGMATAVRQAARELQNRANSQKVAFKVDDLKATGRIEVELDQRSADQTKQKLKDWLDDVSPLKVRVELDIANGTGAAVSARLQVLTRPRTVPIVPELDNTAVLKVATALAALSGARVLNNIFEKLGNTIKNLDKSVPIIGSLSLAVAGLAGWGLSAASNLAALSASLASIGATALLLPGLLGGMAVGLGVTIAAFRDFNKILPEVKAALSGLQDSISENFWAKAAEPIRTMVDELLPEFTAGVAQTSIQLGGFFAGFSTSLQGALNPALTQMFTDLSASITVATTGTGAFANIIAVLGRVGTSYLPALAQWFVDISTRFSDFLTRSEGNGNLKGWIDEGIQALKDLGSVLLNVGGILASIARAAEAAGGSSLGMLADTLARIHSVVDSSGFQAGLVGVFSAAHQAMQQIATVSGPAVESLFTMLAGLLTAVLPQVGAIIGQALSAVAGALAQPAIFSGVVALLNGLQLAVMALAPAMAPLGQALGALMTVVGAFAAMLGPLVAAALVPLAQAFTALAPSIIPIVQLLGGALTTAIQALAPIVAQLVPVVGAMLAAAFGLLQAILPVVAQLFQQIVTAVAPLVQQLISGLAPVLPVIAGFISQVLTALMPVVSILIEIVSAVITPLIPMLQSIVSAILPPLADAFQRVAEAVQPLLEALLAVVNFLMPILVPVIQFVIQILGGALVACINGVALVLEGFVEFFKGVWNTVKGVFEIFWGLFEGIFTGNWDTFKQGFEDLWDGILGMLKGVWDVILGALEVFLNAGILGLAGKALKAIRALWDAAWGGIRMAGVVIWDAIKSAFTGFGSTLSGLGSSMMSGLGRLFSAGWEAIKSAAGSAMSALGRAISTGVTNAIRFVRELPGRARAALSSLGSTLVSAGKALIRGFIDGITSMFGTVKDKLGSLTSKLTDWKGPESLDRVLLVGAGQLVIDGFIKGLESRYDAVRKSLSGLTDEVADTSFALPSMRQTGASHAINTALSTALNARSEGGGGTTRVLNYYAAPGSSLDSEEDLFAAANRARMAGW
ncbi:hypothetical protein KQY30_25770 [Streptomyces sp. GMY02]|uniref:phage tail protein n=1 Tax=Streptomyces sp. GMY02 TaxID=1333528 RepID=UPI001C2BEF6B|nr:hypothetical protein [Streptomyces sp. GMY02]QXE37118.1 hypothetical protein KQY30_25770 [Streptomyces sp. GMY02]